MSAVVQGQVMQTSSHEQYCSTTLGLVLCFSIFLLVSLGELLNLSELHLPSLT